MNVSSTDVAWAAGLFEGEGSIGNGNQSGFVRMVLGSTDFDVVERFAAIVGCGTVNPRRASRIGVKPMREWQANGDAAVRVLTMFMPYLGARRRAKAVETLKYRADLVADAVRERECVSCGKPFRPRWGNGVRTRKYCDDKCKLRENIRVRDEKRRLTRLERTA